MRQHRWRSLQSKLILGLVLMSVALTAVLITAIAQMYRSRMEDYYSQVAFDQASIAAQVIDGDRIAGYYATGEKDDYYEEIREYLLMVKQIVGLGILLAKKLMDDIEYEFQDGQNILTLRKTVR